ncbi:MAG: hypothetical protein HY925_05250, partial [Elusimicrobia bacterium]|nr:hypothetical protein [Elusimicrobiota bacterium]
MQALVLMLLSAFASATVLPSKTFQYVLIDDRDSKSERKRIEDALARLARAPSLAGLRKRRAALGSIPIRFADLSRDPDTKELRAVTIRQPPAVELGLDLLNPKIEIEGTLAHELFGHSVLHGEARSHGLNVGLLMEDEAFALAVGAVAALETGREPEDSDRSAALVEGGIDGYRDVELFTRPTNDLELTLTETTNPVGAVRARLAELERRRRSLDISERSMKAWEWQFDHFISSHGAAPEAFAGLRGWISDWRRDGIDGRRPQLDNFEPFLKKHLEWLTEYPEGQDRVRQLLAISTHPYAAALRLELAALSARFGELLRAR